MTLPISIQLPVYSDWIKTQNPEEMKRYMQQMNQTLEEMYETFANTFNGLIRNDAQSQRNQWLPVLKGTTSAGTFTYVNQYGWSFRQGIWVDAWGDISWTATNATGNIFVELPYIVAITNGIPFVGVVQPSALTLTGGTGIVINAISNTYRGEFWNIGNGFTTARQAVTATGRVIFHVRYISKDDEQA